ncbi:aminoacetone oxidase family FAD-binding enzyme [Candidatus Nomurabacteria bacterium]|nr:aminoacetone oxidase family FAD-binding enzyme [Candidatus Nomurabacteria bacterium]MCB9819399.1 aminoacetone oxidase family FAD-binding enzyme [Candidatus Nomurabacteria bacterium]
MDNTHHFDVIVIGGGAAGLMAAGRAAERGRKVLLFEKNKKVGKKLSISGGGRCNITNAEEDLKVLLSNYGSSEQFLYSAFSEFGVKETFKFFESRKLPLKVEERKRVFPKSEKAPDVVSTLTEYVANENVDLRLGTPVRQILVADGLIKSVVASGGEYTADSYIFASGGVSHPETGSTGDGFAWLRELGHTVKEPTPTIVPLKARDAWIRTLMGKTLTATKITFYQGNKKCFASSGDILLTHFGLSGPTILNSAGAVSDLLHTGPVTARIDLFPKLDVGESDKMLVDYFEDYKNKLLKNVIRELLPPGTADGLLALVPSIDPEKKVHSITREERRSLIDTFKTLPVNISGLMGYDKAVVADGGVPLTEMDMRTFRSLRSPNIFIVGDLLNIKRPSGGFSLQLCWTTGYIAGNHA